MAKFNLNNLLNNASKETHQRSTLKIVPISVHNLVPAEENFYSTEQIEDLKRSIEMFGIKQNLLVTPLNGDKYQVIAGHRRRLAALALVEEGKTEFEMIPCVVENSQDKIMEKLQLITTNATTRQLTDWEKIEQAKEIRALLEAYKKRENLPGRVRDLIAEALGTSPAQVGRMAAIEKNLTPDFKDEIKEGKVNISTAYEISKLPKENQKHMFDKHKKTGKTTMTEAQEYREAMRRREKAGQTTIADLTDVPIGWDLPEEPERLTNFQRIMQDEAKIKQILVKYMKAKCGQCPCETEKCAEDCTATILRWLEATER